MWSGELTRSSVCRIVWRSAVSEDINNLPFPFGLFGKGHVPLGARFLNSSLRTEEKSGGGGE